MRFVVHGSVDFRDIEAVGEIGSYKDRVCARTIALPIIQQISRDSMEGSHRSQALAESTI